MKIAIMTQPLGKNYGGIMQAWALQQVLKRMGHDPVTIDRQPNTTGFFHHVAKLGYRTTMKALGTRKAPVNFEKYLPYILQNTQKFIKKHINTSEPLYSTKELKDHFLIEKYDAVIVGSDQTWRPSYSPDIYNYYLDFLEDINIIKIAYASSFGLDNWEYTKEQTHHCARLAKKFDAISVREISGEVLCAENLNIKATTVLDPTLLVEKMMYENIIKNKCINPLNGGIYTYFLDNTTKRNMITSEIAAEIGEHTHSFQPLCGINSNASANISDYVMPPIERWLSGFLNSKVVITDSFHGMIFAIIFEKPFVVIKNEKRGMARFSSLAKTMKVEENIIEESQLSTEIIIKMIKSTSPKNRTNITNISEEWLSLSLLMDKHND